VPRLLNRLSQAALRHRATIRRILPKGLHHLAGTLARGLIRAVEAARSGAAAGADGLTFPEPLRPPEFFRPHCVAMVNDGLSSGGSERQIVNTLTGLQARAGFDAQLLCWRLGETPDLSFYAADLERAGIPFRNVCDKPDFFPHSDIAGAKLWLDEALDWAPQDVRDKILRLTADLVALRPGIVHGWQDETALVTGFAGLLAGVPHILVAARNVNPSGFGYYRPFMGPAYAALAACPRIVFVNNSAAGARDYERWAGLPPGRFAVLRNGVEQTGAGAPSPAERRRARSQLELPEAAEIIGTVMRFNQEKRPLLWLQTARKCLARRPQAHFLMAGDGPMRAKLQSEAKRLGIADRLHLPGPVRPVETALHAMDLFLLTSRFEGLPNVTLEAGLAGLPVVTTDAGGARETIRIGETGLVVEADGLDENQLAEALGDAVCTVLEDPAWTDRARRLGPAFVSDTFGMRRMIDETIALYGTPEQSD